MRLKDYFKTLHIKSYRSRQYVAYVEASYENYSYVIYFWEDRSRAFRHNTYTHKSIHSYLYETFPFDYM